VRMAASTVTLSAAKECVAETVQRHSRFAT